ncbi:MAG: tetratricopeptide repeat protein [Bacteroidetes bacterium]|nr:tetratricopeptide repeat protein [Bacteroidota bacterium]
MSKKAKGTVQSNPHQVVTEASIPKVANLSFWDKLTHGWMPHIIIAVLGFVLYANTFQHEYALDDELIVCGNDYVLQGTAGINSIMTGDIFDSHNKQLNAEANLAGGRYRPFSLATFAVEQEFIGTQEAYNPDAWDKNQNKVGDVGEDANGDGVFNDKDAKVKGMSFRHINNVLLYILSISILFMFLSRFFFKDQKLLALLVALLFMAHPIHTEVVANVKSRDEILSLLFMVLTLHFSFLYVETKKMKLIVYACISYMIALLSKEYGVTLLIILPASIYVYYKDVKLKSLATLFIGIGITFMIYYALRSSVVLDLGENAKQDSELLNNPFKDAVGVEAIATKIFINLKYFLLLLFPVKLSCDYSFKVIEFRTFANPEVWVSALVLITLAASILFTLKKRNWLAFPLLFILMHMLLINNFFFNIGATMGERLVYHSSLGVCILIVYGLHQFLQKMKVSNPAIISVLVLPLLLAYSMRTIARNPAWKNNITLYTTDVKTYPNSTMLNGNACISLFDMSNMPVYKSREKNLLDSASTYGYKALSLHPGYFYTHINLGLVKAKQGNMDSATYHWLKAREMSPYEKQLPAFLDNAAAHYYNKGMGFFNQNQLAEALKEFNRAHEIKPNDHRPLYFIGMVQFRQGNFRQAKEAWTKAISFAPGDANLQKALQDVAQY